MAAATHTFRFFAFSNVFISSVDYGTGGNMLCEGCTHPKTHSRVTTTTRSPPAILRVAHNKPREGCTKEHGEATMFHILCQLQYGENVFCEGCTHPKHTSRVRQHTRVPACACANNCRPQIRPWPNTSTRPCPKDETNVSFLVLRGDRVRSDSRCLHFWSLTLPS